MRNATIVGLGLIGGSIAKALREKGWTVSFIDPAVAEEEARAAGAAETKRLSLDDVEPHDTIILCMPADVTLRMLETIPQLPNLLTSVCSVMEPLQRAAHERGLHFVAGHPLAGSEKKGLSNADAALFRERNWFLDESAEDGRLTQLVSDCSARPVPVSSSRHDAMMALTSHLPQILSTALASVIAVEHVSDEFFGSGLRTFLRLAGSERAVWHSVVESNSEHIDAALVRLEKAINDICNGEDDEHFERANELYRKLTR